MTTLKLNRTGELKAIILFEDYRPSGCQHSPAGVKLSLNLWAGIVNQLMIGILDHRNIDAINSHQYENKLIRKTADFILKKKVKLEHICIKITQARQESNEERGENQSPADR